MRKRIKEEVIISLTSDELWDAIVAHYHDRVFGKHKRWMTSRVLFTKDAPTNVTVYGYPQD